MLSAGDVPGYILEFIATRLTQTQPVYVLGNHSEEYVRRDDPETTQHVSLPGGCINVHGRVLEVGGVLIAGIEGSPRYRSGPHQYSELQLRLMTHKLTPRLLYNRARYGRAVDIFLTHAAPKGPHEGADYPHRGVAAFNSFDDRWQPKLHIHGHVHLSGANAQREYVTGSGVRVVNAFGFTLLEL